MTELIDAEHYTDLVGNPNVTLCRPGLKPKTADSTVDILELIRKVVRSRWCLRPM